MSQIVVRPNGPLEGAISIGGAKNSALKLMAASLLAEGEYHQRNMPDITDVGTLAELLTSMGVEVHRPAGRLRSVGAQVFRRPDAVDGG